jgi:hypothetical protein
MLVGDRLHAKPLVGEIEEVRLTVPVKPLCAVTVIVEVPVAPARAVTAVGLAVTVYGVPDVTVTVAAFVRPLPVPVTVTVKVPGVEEVQERVEAPLVVPLLSMMLVGDNVQTMPLDGETAAVMVTVPVNPLRPVIVTLEVPVPPEAKFRVVGLAATVKSCTV